MRVEESVGEGLGAEWMKSMDRDEMMLLHGGSKW